MTTEAINQAAELFKQGRKEEARKLLIQAITEDPNNPSAWYGLFFCVDDLERKRDYLLRVLDLNPDHQPAKEALQKLQIAAQEQSNLLAEQSSAGPPPRPRITRDRINTAAIVSIALLLIFLIILFLSSNLPVFGIGGILVAALLLLFYFRPTLLDIGVDWVFMLLLQVKRLVQPQKEIRGILAELGPGYFVMPNVRSKYDSIDYIVLSRTGKVFAIQIEPQLGGVQFSSDRLLINGREPRIDYLAQSLTNAFWLRGRIESALNISPWITKVLLFTRAYLRTPQPIQGVYVVNPSSLITTIHSIALQGNADSFLWDHQQEIVTALRARQSGAPNS